MLWPTELLDAAEVGKLRPRRKGPFYDGGGRGPQHVCTDLAAPKRNPAVSVDRLEPYHSRVARHSPGPLSGSGGVAGGGPASQPQDPPRRRRGRAYCLVRWQGRPSADDSWEPMELLAPFSEQVAEYEVTAARRLRAVRAWPGGGRPWSLPRASGAALEAPATPHPPR